MNRTDAATARGRLLARLRIWACCALVLLVILVSTFFAGRPLQGVNSKIRESHRATAAQMQVAGLQASLSDFQLLLDPSLTVAQSASSIANNLAKAAQLAQTITVETHAVARALTGSGLGATARTLESANTDFTKAYSGLAPLAAGLPIAKVSAAITAERLSFTRFSARTTTATKQLQLISERTYDQGMRSLREGRTTVLILGALAALLTLLAGLLLGQRAHRRESREREDAQRQTYANSLQEALEMSSAEPAVYRIVGKALAKAVPQLKVEMLLADSSRAHFHQTLTTAASEDVGGGCGVASPLDCPATIRGHTLLFETSSALNACPHLQDRTSGGCSAVCVPISIAGKTVGVTHATGPDKIPPSSRDVRYLEITTRRASERVAMLRAFEKSETQAHSDPLTGLSNRRSLENRVRDLQRERVGYAVAYGDLDHFKLLNDTHGHEAGDQALRMFSRVLRDSIRPTDIAARYGGEEFVLVLPNSDAVTATVVLERIRERLALALTSGRNAPFTVSFGLADSADADTFDDVVAVADKALLAAKAAGRNRVVVAAAKGGPVTAETSS